MSGKLHILLVDASQQECCDIVPIFENKYIFHIENDYEGAMRSLEEESPALILLNADIGERDCFDVLREWKADSRYADIPVILLLDSREEEESSRAIQAGASDLIVKPVPDVVMKLCVERTLELAGLHQKMEHKEEQIDQFSLQSIMTIAQAIDAKDRYANGRTVRVALCSCEIARKLGWEGKQVEDLYYVALLHDIGNIAVEDAILNKPAPLTEKEFEVIKQHTIIGGEMVKDTNFIPGVEEGVRYHHEHFDGKGYDGLAGHDIPEIARIIAVADAYEAMVSNRAYRKGMPPEQVEEELLRGRGSQFDPKVVDALLDLLKEGMVIDEKAVEQKFEPKERSEEVGRLLRQVFKETLSEVQSELEKDALTGFLNRNYFESKINNYLLKPNAHGTFFMMDLDNFKSVNDTYGHAAGDTLLMEFANVLQENTRGNDFVCRIGGDEFAIFFPGLDKDHVIRQRAENIIRLFSKKRKELGYENCSVSIGIFTKYVGGNEVTCEALYGYADKALYFVKNNGKDDYHLYSYMSSDDRNSNLLEKQMKLPALLRQVAERKYNKGAYLVEYDRFTYIYQFIVRNIERSCRQVQVVMISLETDEDTIMQGELLEDCMMIVETAVTHSLRRGDVTTRLSKTQQIVMLIDANEENGRMVAERIVAKYKSLAGDRAIPAYYDISEVPVTEEALNENEERD